MLKLFKQKNYVAAIILFLFVCLFVLSFEKYYSSYFSRQLICYIENDEFNSAVQLINEHPEIVNTLPSTDPWWWQLFTEQSAVCYPLQEACSWGRYDIVVLLINNGADCNLVWKGIEGSKSPLICAVVSGADATEDIITLLIEKGADKSYCDERGMTAYDYAVEFGYAELTSLLQFRNCWIQDEGTVLCLDTADHP